MTGVADLLVDATLNYARLLIQAAQPREAYRVLTEVAPVSALEHPAVLAEAATLAEKIDHAFDDEAYLRRYGAYEPDNASDTIIPFSDKGVMGMYRAQLAVTLAKQHPPKSYLSIGGGEGSVPRAILDACPDAKLHFSELREVSGPVVQALEAQFPGRVATVGRFDDDIRIVTAQYDFVECLEVVEHVVDDFVFLRNLANALTDDGWLVLSTPNSVDWFERVLLERKWYHHLTAYTAESLATKMLGVGLRPTIYVANGCLHAVAQKCRPVTELEDLGWVDLSAGVPDRVGICTSDKALTANGAAVPVVNGLIIRSSR
jgi:hypothetical protein